MARSQRELFVDRELQLDRFRRILDGRTTKRIVVIAAPEGMGKSWLLRQFVEECNARIVPTMPTGVPNALIDFGDDMAYGPLLLVQRLRDELEELNCARLSETINEITLPRVQIGGGSSGTGTGVTIDSSSNVNVDVSGNVAGRDIITVKDSYFVVQTDNALLRQVLDERVTAVFSECLRELASRALVVLFFDAYERTALGGERWEAGIADRWVTRTLLEPIREGRLQNVAVVLAGTRLPPFGPEWNDVVGTMDLPRFERADVATYLRTKRNLGTLSDEQITALYTAVQGNPTLLGVIGDNLESASATRNDDDW